MEQVTRTKISAEEYFQLPEYQQHTLIQLIDGEVIIGMAPIPKHQDIVREILFLFTLASRQKGGKAYSSPIEVSLDDENIFEPDVLYLKPNSACTIQDKRLVSAPDLVVEVLSPSTAKHDREQKYRAYEQNGVGEYWVVDPLYEVLEVWTLQEGRFDRQGAYAAGDTFTSQTLNEVVQVKDIFKE